MLRRLVGVLCLLVAAAGVAYLLVPGGSSTKAPPRGADHQVNRARPPANAIDAGWPSAAATRAENARPGDDSWLHVRGATVDQMAGWADHDSIAPGDPVRLFIRAVSPPVTVTAYRMGWYDGKRARKVWTSPPVGATVQPAPTFDPATRTVSAANWHPSLAVATGSWVPGDYLFRLQDGAGRSSFVPLTVRAPTTEGAVVLVNGVTTWQAYNAFGGYSLYKGPNGAYATRAYAVSFDRPYDTAYGATDFWGNERPMVSLVERLGLPVAYVTDVDLHRDPHLLDGARAVFSLGHDEYWSQAMRDHLTAARDAGTNVAFLGANAIYRHIRLSPTPVGPFRLETDYKDGRLDPVLKVNPAEATFQWRQGPDPRPESVLTGTFYECNPVQANMVVVDPSAWVFAGTGLAAGAQLPGLIGSEYDRVNLSVPTPRPIQVLTHSPVTCRGKPSYSDMAYYTVPSGAGGFNVGTSTWVCVLDDFCGRPLAPGVQAAVTKITTNLVQVFAAGPAGRAHPARDNLAALGIH